MLNILNKKIVGVVLILLVGGVVFYQAQKEDAENSVGTESNETLVEKIKDIVGEDQSGEEVTESAPATTKTTTPSSSTTSTTTKPSTTTTTTTKPSTTTTTPTTTTKPSGITMTEIAKHSTKADCWSAINGSVYDLTSWVPNHPGGEKRILILCGKDGSDDYNGAHGSKTKIFNILSGFKIGSLAS